MCIGHLGVKSATLDLCRRSTSRLARECDLMGPSMPFPLSLSALFFIHYCISACNPRCPLSCSHPSPIHHMDTFSGNWSDTLKKCSLSPATSLTARVALPTVASFLSPTASYDAAALISAGNCHWQAYRYCFNVRIRLTTSLEWIMLCFYLRMTAKKNLVSRISVVGKLSEETEG